MSVQDHRQNYDFDLSIPPCRLTTLGNSLFHRTDSRHTIRRDDFIALAPLLPPQPAFHPNSHGCPSILLADMWQKLL